MLLKFKWQGMRESNCIDYFLIPLYYWVSGFVP
nr:MAG TPA: hypothetical protein [Caudoviricetes sp.]